MSEEVVYVSNVQIERVKGPYRRAYLPVVEEPVAFGVHDEIAEHYGTDMTLHEPHAATLDYMVAATAGWLTGTFGGALEARGIPASAGNLVSHARGEIEKDGKVLVVKRIHVTYHLKADPQQRETIERVLGFHADFCPVYRTIRDCVDISTSLEIEEVERWLAVMDELFTTTSIIERGNNLTSSESDCLVKTQNRVLLKFYWI